jgi:serine protease Do
MIVREKPLKTTIINTDHLFQEIKLVSNQERSGIISLTKRVLFIRYIGIQKDEESYIDTLTKLDQEIKSLNVGYLRIENGLYNNFSQDEIKDMERVWDEYLKIEMQIPLDSSKLYNLSLGYKLKQGTLEWTKKVLFKEIMTLFDQNNVNRSYSTRRNFGIKFLIWMNTYLKQLFDNNFDMDHIPKVIYYGDIKKTEQYFLLFLSKLGCDVLYMNPKGDVKELLIQFKKMSILIKQPLFTQSIIKIPKIVDLIKIKVGNELPTIQSNVGGIVSNVIISGIKREPEKSYEELAGLSQSVILINVYDNNNQITGRGSGVVLTKNGYIITNCHVVCNGVCFGILFENNEKEYFTKKIVKYHQEYDLALLKIEKETEPLIISPNEELVRGQKIVAIGSPLGLFNTISDGIISGFRDFGDIEVLQITAPISPGSSGGALLDMHGNLIGITTAGFEGQNLNLAVGTKYIKLFANQIISR